MRLLVPDRQWFTDELLVGVAAMANNGGTLLDNLGLEKVTLYYEGETLDIVAPSIATFNDSNGNSVSYLGWWAKLKKPTSTAGYASVYFEAVPKDTTMQNRVMGPYLFAPQDVLHDIEATVEPSQPESNGVDGIYRYQTIYEAQVRLKVAGAQNPRITVKETGVFESLLDQFTNAWTIKGYCTIEGDVPFTIGKATRDYNDATMQPNRTPVHLKGSNCTLDFANVSSLNVAAGGITDHWLDGINITNSAGRDDLWRGGPPQTTGRLVVGTPWFTECVMDNVHVPLRNLTLARGGTATTVAQDMISGSYCVIGTTITDQSNDTWNTDLPAFTVQYTGGEATATLSRSGGTEGSGGGGLYTATYGANTATFDVENGDLDNYNGTSGDGYWFADVVTWLNTLTGWTATHDATMAADSGALDRRACTGSLAGDRGQGFGATDVKTATVQIYSYHDKHADWYQHEIGTNENVIVMDNVMSEADAQFIFLSPIGEGAERDIFFINNIGVMDPTDGTPTVGASQLSRTNVEMEHVVLAHNTLADQQIWMRTDNSGADFDSYCLLANNVTPEIEWIGAVDVDLPIEGNHLMDGATDPSGATGTSIGGSFDDLFVDGANGDFAPAGDL